MHKINNRSLSLIPSICLVALQLVSTDAFAAGFRLPNQSAFATARGNAFTATADDASAIYYNAAGLTQLSQDELQVGLYAINFNLDFEQAGDSYSNENVWQPVPQIFYAHQLESITVGLGLYAPFGLGNEWGGDSPFTSITTEGTIQYVTLSPVVAFELTDRVSLGAGLTYNYADVELEQGVGLFPDDRIKFSGSDTGVGWTASMMWAPSEKHQFGISYRSALEHELEGSTQVSFNPVATDSRFEVEIPDILSVGYSYRPNPSWNYEIDIEKGGWSSLDSPILEGTPLGDLPYPFQWEDGYIYQLGATKYSERYAYSFGYDWNESVQTEAFYNPAVSDADRHWLNFGISNLNGDHPWTITYQYGWSDRTVENNLPNVITGETANGRFDTSAHALEISWGWRL